MLCHSTGRGNRRSAESLYRSRAPQSWSHPGGLETAHSRPAIPCVTLTVPPDAQQLFFSFSAGQRRIRLFKRDADCRLRNVPAASSHCVLTGNWTAFQFLSRNFHHFLSPNPASAFDSRHIYNQWILFQQGEQIACSGSGIDWEVERQPQTGNTNSQNRL